VLQAAHVVRYWPAELHHELGRLTGVVVRLACALDARELDWEELLKVEEVRARWLIGGRETLLRLRREATARYARAIRAYLVVRGEARVPCAVW
jgi:hypothetical protein